MPSRPALRLVRERKLAELISFPKDGAVLEASGVLARGRDCFVIFDNVRRVARVERSLAPGAPRHGWMGRARSGEGYEDIAYSPRQRRYYLLIEAEKHPDGTFKAVIEECDEEFRFKGRHWVDFAFEERNTGFEGLSPRTRKGKRLYSTVEGISWLADDTFVAVSDLAKEQHPPRCEPKDQSIHIFRLPRSR